MALKTEISKNAALKSATSLKESQISSLQAIASSIKSVASAMGAGIATNSVTVNQELWDINDIYIFAIFEFAEFIAKLQI